VQESVVLELFFNDDNFENAVLKPESAISVCGCDKCNGLSPRSYD
jgi:hypothetical protein